MHSPYYPSSTRCAVATVLSRRRGDDKRIELFFDRSPLHSYYFVYYNNHIMTHLLYLGGEKWSIELVNVMPVYTCMYYYL